MRFRSKKAWIVGGKRIRGNTEVKSGVASPKTGPLYPAELHARRTPRRARRCVVLGPGRLSRAGQVKRNDRQDPEEAKGLGASRARPRPWNPAPGQRRPDRTKLSSRSSDKERGAAGSLGQLTWRVSGSRRGSRATAPAAAQPGPGCS